MARLRWTDAVRCNDYRCVGCGLVLTNEVGMANRKVHIRQGHGYCLNCGRMVAIVLTDIEGGGSDGKAQNL